MELARRERVLAGAEGALLRAVSPQTGERLAEYALPATPVCDRMAAANGRIFIAGTDGSVSCYAAKRGAR
jgi:hypothetical protein